MKNFDWQTEESDDPLVAPPDSTAASAKSGWSRKLALLLGLLVLIAAVFYWQLDRRADAQEKLFEADVLAAFRVWQQAVAQSDEELFNSLLIGTEPAWATTQRSLFHAGLLMDRSQLNLSLAAEQHQLQVAAVEVQLSPDWSTAEIAFEQVYNLIDHPVQSLSTPQQIRLGQALTFRRSADRWFLSPPLDDYWGEWQTEEKSLLAVTYPERDEAWAQRLAQDLNEQLSAVCRRASAAECNDREKIELRLETKTVNPVLSNGWEPSLMDGRLFIIPAFSLVGRPVDDAGYELLYNTYTRPILDVFTSWVDTPIPLPDQELQVLCYPPNGRVPKLIRFISADEWVVDLPDHAFRYLSPMATDEGVILQHYLPGQDSSRLRLTLWKKGQETMVYDGTFSHLMLYPVGWSNQLGQPNLLLHGFGDTPTFTQYSHIALDDCDAGGCRAEALDGFPVWSPDGQYALLLQQRYFLELANQKTNIRLPVGDGFAPFWIDNDHFGYLRFLDETDPRKAGSAMEIVTAEINDHQIPGQFQRLLTIKDFTPPASQPDRAANYITFVTANPANSSELYVALRSYGDEHQQVKIYSVLLKDSAAGLAVDEITLQLTLEGATVGYPSLAAPNGFVPFVVSPNGRWLSAGRPSPNAADTWLIHAHDTALNKSYVYSVGYPSSMFIHPYYDWSKDSNWLVIVDQNYFRLIAPAHNYERLITHDLQNCSHAAWVDPIP